MSAEVVLMLDDALKIIERLTGKVLGTDLYFESALAGHLVREATKLLLLEMSDVEDEYSSSADEGVEQLWWRIRRDDVVVNDIADYEGEDDDSCGTNN